MLPKGQSGPNRECILDQPSTNNALWEGYSVLGVGETSGTSSGSGGYDMPVSLRPIVEATFDSNRESEDAILARLQALPAERAVLDIPYS